LNASTKVVEDPANATATPTQNKIPIADGTGGKLAVGWLPTGTGATEVALGNHTHSTYALSADRGAKKIYQMVNGNITTSQEITGLTANKHFRLNWSGFIDNAGESVANYLWIAFGTEAEGIDTAANAYRYYLVFHGSASGTETGKNPAGSGIYLCHTHSNHDTYFTLAIDIFTGNNVSFLAQAMIRATVSTWRHDDGAYCIWNAGGNYISALATIDRIAIGLETTGAGYGVNSWVDLIQLDA
jgi:hypothetical protein